MRTAGFGREGRGIAWAVLVLAGALWLPALGCKKKGAAPRDAAPETAQANAEKMAPNGPRTEAPRWAKGAQGPTEKRVPSYSPSRPAYSEKAVAEKTGARFADPVRGKSEGLNQGTGEASQ